MPPSGFVTNWTYRPSSPSLATIARRAKCRLKGRAAFPDYVTLIEPARSSEWILYFIYAPSGRIDDGHRYTIDKLRKSRRSLMLVVASESRDMIDDMLLNNCDSLIWKDRGGFDFSGYAVGLDIIAKACPGSSVMVLNDSVLGPFCDLDPQLDRARWDLTGFSANESGENHIQSFAFYFKCVDVNTLNNLNSLFSLQFSFDDFLQTVMLRETQLARIAAKTMSVGSYLYCSKRFSVDPTLQRPLEMIQLGFPFLKRALFGKHRNLNRGHHLARYLKAQHHPVIRPK